MDLLEQDIENHYASIHKEELKHLYATIVENFNVIKKLQLENLSLRSQLEQSIHHVSNLKDHQLNH
ncbi:hypothetical protein [Acinetobacter sp. CFCC 10889]|uniref:hypothetical protein n=1 Tax=Acinetobacter sp. CFCC 10889 TaxID=1775557 RepID=UPI000DD08B76|nr:hypothetical protein [Acinetobacter sp. CFCC 10889]